MRRRLHAVLLGLGLLGLGAVLARQPKPIAVAASYQPAFASTFVTYLQTGQQLAGLGSDVAYQWEEFTSFTTALGPGIPWQPGVAGTGAASNPGSLSGGVYRITSGATAASIYNLYANTSMVANNSTSRWFMAMRFRVQTAITAQTIAAAGIWDINTNGSTTVGVFGANSTTNFVVQYDGSRTGTFLSTGKSIDTSFHVFYLWCVGDNKIHVIVDGGTEASATMGVPAASNSMYLTVGNGTDAVTRNLDIDWALLLAPRS
jgi:hypothetical protein